MKNSLEQIYVSRSYVTAEGFPVCRQAGNPQPSEPKSDIPCRQAGRYPVETYNNISNTLIQNFKLNLMKNSLEQIYVSRSYVTAEGFEPPTIRAEI